ncbi:hypothetical protein [Ralstonia solanacearum]|uniref:hypothetical protein n=2 Tax=Ralstonia solanacearum TaxID=305 RepID=UPI000ABBF896|nr:hypothetical protein [Ralstonia solanacearum]
MQANAVHDVRPMERHPKAMQDVIRKAAYDAHYNRIAYALETHNVERAGTYMLDACEQLSKNDAGRLERELTADYYEFT